jgi:light-regulated signal transduction histidine kinase (bacteriophytochrome)
MHDRIIIDQNEETDLSDGSMNELAGSEAQQILELTSLIQELERENQELRDFAKIVSHDLKAPLRGVRSLAEWIIEDNDNQFTPDSREKFDVLMQRVDRMQNLINGILEYSKAGMDVVPDNSVDLNTVIPEIIDTLYVPEHISVIIADNFPVIRCNKTRITQVFQNLIGNAIKYSDKSTGIIKVNWQDKLNFWQFSIEDNGPGIAPKYHNKIFEVFETLTSRDDIESSGIRLSVVKKIVESTGGSVWVESDGGNGSVFLFTIAKQLGMERV